MSLLRVTKACFPGKCYAIWCILKSFLVNFQLNNICKNVFCYYYPYNKAILLYDIYVKNKKLLHTKQLSLLHLDRTFASYSSALPIGLLRPTVVIINWIFLFYYILDPLRQKILHSPMYTYTHYISRHTYVIYFHEISATEVNEMKHVVTNYADSNNCRNIFHSLPGIYFLSVFIVKMTNSGQHFSEQR